MKRTFTVTSPSMIRRQPAPSATMRVVPWTCMRSPKAGTRTDQRRRPWAGLASFTWK